MLHSMSLQSWTRHSGLTELRRVKAYKGQLASSDGLIAMTKSSLLRAQAL